MSRTLVHLPVGQAVAALDRLRGRDAIDIVHGVALPSVSAFDADVPVLVLATADSLAAAAATARVALATHAAVIALVPTGAELPSDLDEDAIAGRLDPAATDAAAVSVLRSAMQLATAHHAARRSAAEAARRTQELTELTRIGAALSTERDLLTLLTMILSQSRRLANADAGSLYLVEPDGTGATRLRFKLSQNATLPGTPFSEFTIPVDRASIAGTAAVTGAPLAIDDVYQMDPALGLTFNRSIDERIGYRTKSMLTLPMRTHEDETIGVLQLINRTRRPGIPLASATAVEAEVLPFDAHAITIVSALASQAAVAIENAKLYEDIERLFEGFVSASVTAIEQRDPTTSGHSFRVATFTTGLAEAIDRVSSGPYRDTRFSRDELRELRYASLLHDFGKVGVREQVLVKQKKLYPADLSIIRHRFQVLLQKTDLVFERERADYLLEFGRAGYEDAVVQLDRRRMTQREELHRFLDAIVRANEPTVLAEGTFEELEEINHRLFVDFDGVERPLLADDELRYLMINRGNLDERERREIESHVTHTYRFLEQIPWTRTLKGIPAIAHGHHEKLDGSGYPRRLTADAIPVQTRMMTISDIYDALTATDRPYKRAVTPDKALDILHDEAKHAHVDLALLTAFVEAKVFALVGDEQRRSSGAQRSVR
ncbi:MAG: GAF domain-containing protein [Gemmatimonadaceae bacterium]|nr:GAF domain-containing protein [Gemmatimonadaceae bacterium]